MTTINYRLIDIDALDPESAFPADLLTPQYTPVSSGEIQGLANNCRQLLQRGEQEEALVAGLEGAPYGGDDQGKVGFRWESRAIRLGQQRFLMKRGMTNRISTSKRSLRSSRR